MSNWIRHIIRFVVSVLVLMGIGYIIPGFDALNIVHAFLAALVITALGYLIEIVLGEKVSPYNRGIVGFLVSTIVIWVTQFIVPGMNVSIIGALLASIVIGIVDTFVPTTLR
jgi:putative membrane protein